MVKRHNTLSIEEFMTNGLATVVVKLVSQLKIFSLRIFIDVLVTSVVELLTYVLYVIIMIYHD